MTDERVEVSIRGSRPFVVDRNKLASALKTASQHLAGHLGKRPGEATGTFIRCAYNNVSCFR